MRKERKHKINTDIKFNTVRLVGMGEPQVLTFFEAFNIARNEGKDLILISENGDTPIVRIEEYTKFLFNLEKKEKEQKKKSAQTETHEIKLSCEIADHDLNTKAKKAAEFLEDGDKVKVVIQLKGRQNTHADRGELVMLKFAALLDKVGLPEAFPKLESSKWLMNMKPLPTGKK
jgi:translation initiation factor IF-3